MYHKTFLSFLLTVASMSALGQQMTDAQLKELLDSKIRVVRIFSNNPVLVKAVQNQNAEKLSLDTIKQRDREWSNTGEPTSFMLSLQQNKAGVFLKKRIDTNSAFSEAFLTDNQGANVAMYPPTSDYWQGDEEKWTASFNGGKGQVFVGKIEQDASTGTASTQISVPVIDQNKTIGVLVMGIKLDYIKEKQARNK